MYLFHIHVSVPHTLYPSHIHPSGSGFQPQTQPQPQAQAIFK